jgi:hypothetical protein
MPPTRGGDRRKRGHESRAPRNKVNQGLRPVDGRLGGEHNRSGLWGLRPLRSSSATVAISVTFFREICSSSDASSASQQQFESYRCEGILAHLDVPVESSAPSVLCKSRPLHRELIVYREHPRRGLSDSFGFLPLGIVRNLAAEHHLASRSLRMDPLGIHLGHSARRPL